jgi:hypothetical protein
MILLGRMACQQVFQPIARPLAHDEFDAAKANVNDLALKHAGALSELIRNVKNQSVVP